MKLLPESIRTGWLKQLYDSKLFEDGDDKEINMCLLYWSMFIGKLLKEDNFANREEFITIASKIAFERHEYFKEFGWKGLIQEKPPRNEEEVEAIEEEETDEWFDFINSEYFLKFTFLLDFITSSAFQFDLFKAFFKTPSLIKERQLEFPFTVLRPKVSYAKETQLKKLNQVIGPMYDYSSIVDIPDIILPLSLSSDVNEQFWEEFVNSESFRIQSKLSIFE